MTRSLENGPPHHLRGGHGVHQESPIISATPDFAKIRALRKHYVTGLKQLICPQSLIHGWAGLVITRYPVMYVWEYVTAGCKAFSLANGKGMGTNDREIKSLD